MPYPSTSVTTQRPEFGVPFQEFLDMPGRFGHVGLKVLSPILVSLQNHKYYVEELKDEYQAGNLLRAANGAYNRMARQFTEVSYSTKELGIEYRLDDRVKAIFYNLPAAEASAQRLLWKATLAEIERVLVAKLTDAAVITQTSAVAASWNSAANSKPITDISTAVLAINAATSLEADTVVMSYKKFRNCLNSAEVIDRIKYWGQDPNMGAMMASIPTLAAALGVRRVLVAGMKYDTADKGQAVSLASRWPDGTIGVYCTAPAGSGISEACIGRTPTWAGDGAGIGEGEEPSLQVESYREEQTRSDVWRVRAELDCDSNVVYPEAGYLLTGADA